jgi:carboxylesterase type B
MKFILPFLSDPEIMTIISWYNTTKFQGSAFYQAAAIIGDRFFYCPTTDIAMGLAKMGVPVYKYRFNQKPLIAKWIFDFFNSLGVFHFSEIPVIFPLRFMQVGHDERTLSDTMVNAWVTFAKTGTPILSSPDTNEHLDWPRYVVNATAKHPRERVNVVLHAPVQNILVENDVHKDEICLKWKEIEHTRGSTF